MSRRVWPNKREHGRQHAHQNRQPNAAPSTSVIKRPKDLRRRASRSHDPERDKNSKEATNVQHQNNPFDEGQPFGEICVEDDGKEADQQNKQRRVPSFEHIRGVIYDNQALNLRRRNECDAGDSRLPTENTDPSSYVAEKLLATCRREFGNPVILPARSGRHGSHLGH